MSRKQKKENEEKILQIMEEKYKLENGKYAIKKALDECEFIKDLISDKPDESLDARKHNLEDCIKLSRVIYQTKKSKGKHKEFEEKRILKEIFYRLETMNRLSDEIENKILDGEKFNNETFRELQRKYHLYEEFKKVYGDPKKIIEEKWKKTSEDLNRMTPEEISSLRFFKEQQSSEEKRIKEGPKPFDEFNMSLVLAAKINKLISREEALILKYRYNLEGHRINSLRLVAGWLEVSHTTVRNAEKRALKKIQDKMSILKHVRVNKPQRKEMSKEEYKRRFGYYPDLGKE